EHGQDRARSIPPDRCERFVEVGEKPAHVPVGEGTGDADGSGLTLAPSLMSSLFCAMMVVPGDSPDLIIVCVSLAFPSMTGRFCATPLTTAQTYGCPLSLTIASLGTTIACGTYVVRMSTSALMPSRRYDGF